ncbi:MAG: class I SAM-dependent methyltransferase [Thermodesulfobacteriota bacterium]|nr:class I SAM-dependent methyltransferase [Thermodesulfobacteriota bacterium]
MSLIKRFSDGLYRFNQSIRFRGTSEYWEKRYQKGGTSGSGSFERLAQFKAEVLNRFVQGHKVASVLEFGCGDGNQLALAAYPFYIGLDVSQKAISLCHERHKNDPTKSFFLYDAHAFFDNAGLFSADLTISLDVIYHLVEDDVYHLYMTHLFSCSRKNVIIYSSNHDEYGRSTAHHVRHRHFSPWVESHCPDYALIEKIRNRYHYDLNSAHNTSFSDFYIYEKRSQKNSGDHESA